jgi:uncharacterized membrane protein
MQQSPEFWRTEVWHPLSVHFPIALLIFATLAYLVSYFLKAERQLVSYQMAKILLYLGAVAAWIAIYTGDMADGIVSRQICDPTVLKDHEIGAYTLSILFAVAAGIQLLLDFRLLSFAQKPFRALVLLLMLVGSGFLIYAGHLGASLVYQQGAGVYHPSANCQEFE